AIPRPFRGRGGHGPARCGAARCERARIPGGVRRELRGPRPLVFSGRGPARRGGAEAVCGRGRRRLRVERERVRRAAALHATRLSRGAVHRARCRRGTHVARRPLLGIQAPAVAPRIGRYPTVRSIAAYGTFAHTGELNVEHGQGLPATRQTRTSHTGHVVTCV